MLHDMNVNKSSKTAVEHDCKGSSCMSSFDILKIHSIEKVT